MKEELQELLEEYEYIRKQLEQSREKSNLYMKYDYINKRSCKLYFQR